MKVRLLLKDLPWNKEAYAELGRILHLIYVRISDVKVSFADMEGIILDIPDKTTVLGIRSIDSRDVLTEIIEQVRPKYLDVMIETEEEVTFYEP